MRTEGQIRRKFKQAKFRHMQKRIKEVSKKTPCNCKHNENYVSANGKQVGLCKLAGTGVVVCDDDMPEGKDVASSCLFFQPRQSQQDIKDEIDEILTEKPLHIVAHHFPDLVALLWVLGEENEVNEWLTASNSWVEIHPTLSVEAEEDVVQGVPEEHIAAVVEDPPTVQDPVKPVSIFEETLSLGNNDSQIEPVVVDKEDVVVGAEP